MRIQDYGRAFALALSIALGGTALLAQPAGSRLWELETRGRIGGSPSIGKDGTIYVGAGSELLAIGRNGALKWRYRSFGPMPGTPAVGADGTIFCGSYDHHVYALSPTGAVHWTYTTGDRVCSSPALALDGTIYVGSDDGHLHALTPSGAPLWRFYAGGYVRSSPAIGADGTVYFGSHDRHLYAVSPQGKLLWSFPTGHYVASSPAIGLDHTIYVGSANGRLYAVSPDGQRLWEAASDGHLYSSPVLAPDGSIYIGSWDTKLYAFSPDGKRKWALATGDLIQSTPVVAADGTIYVGSDEGKLYAISPEGSKKWAYTARSVIRSSPVLTPEGNVLFGDEEGVLYALRGAGAPAQSPWPMFHADSAHRGKILLVITRQPESQLVIQHRPVSFEVQVKGAGPIGCQWQLNGTNVAGADQFTLAIPEARPDQAGDYTAVLTNAAERLVSLPATLKVMVPPVITTGPKDLFATVKSNVVLRVVASSLGPLTYQWTFQSTNMPSAISPELALPQIQASQAGPYAVIVSNPAGAITSAVANLTVVTVPEIKSPPQPRTVVTGSPLQLTVEAASAVPVQYQWQLNGSNISGATSQTLTLSSAQATNAGNYSVVVSNPAGRISTPPVPVIVVLPPVFSSSPKSVAGVAGQKAVFNATVASTGPVGYQWFFGQQLLSNALSDNLVISNLGPQHTGEFRVVVTNLAGSITSMPAHLSLLYPPVLLAPPSPQTNRPGKDATFSVNATGSPPLRFFWYFNETNLLDSESATLELRRVSPDQAGLYSVTVSNQAGSVRSPPVPFVIPTNSSWWQRLKDWF